MAFNTRWNIGFGALVVALIFIVVLTRSNIQFQDQLNQMAPTVKAFKNIMQGNPVPATQTLGKMTPEYVAPPKSHDIARPNPIIDKLRQNGKIILPEKEAMEAMSDDALYQTYHSYLDNIDLRCSRKLRMGMVGDGGWEICDDEKYRPSSNCLVYSFGINNDFSFDDDVSRVYNCSVISFDPSMKKESYQRSPLVYFLKMGIAGKDYVNKKNWQLKTLGSFLKKFNHLNKVIDVLKMDVESSEWPSLPEMVSSGHLRQVRQLLIEYHGRPTDKPKLLSELSLLKDINDVGFRKFYVHKNFHCGFKDIARFPVSRTSCYEVHYVNVNLV